MHGSRLNNQLGLAFAQSAADTNIEYVLFNPLAVQTKGASEAFSNKPLQIFIKLSVCLRYLREVSILVSGQRIVLLFNLNLRTTIITRITSAYFSGLLYNNVSSIFRSQMNETFNYHDSSNLAEFNIRSSIQDDKLSSFTTLSRIYNITINSSQRSLIYDALYF